MATPDLGSKRAHTLIREDVSVGHKAIESPVHQLSPSGLGSLHFKVRPPDVGVDLSQVPTSPSQVAVDVGCHVVAEIAVLHKDQWMSCGAPRCKRTHLLATLGLGGEQLIKILSNDSLGQNWNFVHAAQIGQDIGRLEANTVKQTAIEGHVLISVIQQLVQFGAL